ncbi:hypothetical protein HBB04_02398 [Pseudomonas coronafaciens]|nr:hypothetical protein HBB04_02398 [Pseudomonas coronafaciens]
MSVKRSFLMTYSVTPNEEKHKPHADRARRKIGEMQTQGWSKIEDVETAFGGELTLRSSTTGEQRAEAEGQVTEVIKKLMTEVDAFAECWVHFSILVDGLGAHISSRV